MRHEQRHVAHASGRELLLGDVERSRGGGFRLGSGTQSAGIALERSQRVGDFLQSTQYSLAVLGRRAVEIRKGAASSGAELAAVKERLQQSAAEIPRLGSGAEQVLRGKRLRTDRAGEVELRLQIRRGYSGLRRRLVQQGLCSADVRALADQFGWYRDGQLGGQRQALELELG